MTKTLAKKTIAKLLNDAFTTENNENKSRTEAFIDENNIKMRG